MLTTDTTSEAGEKLMSFAQEIILRFPRQAEFARMIVRGMGLDDKYAIGTAMIAGIVMIIVGGIVYMLGVFLVSTVAQSIPLITSGALNTTQAQAQTNIANAFNIVGIGLVVGGIIAILYEILPIAAMFMGGRRQ